MPETSPPQEKSEFPASPSTRRPFCALILFGLIVFFCLPSWLLARFWHYELSLQMAKNFQEPPKDAPSLNVQIDCFRRLSQSTRYDRETRTLGHRILLMLLLYSLEFIDTATSRPGEILPRLVRADGKYDPEWLIMRQFFNGLHPDAVELLLNDELRKFRVLGVTSRDPEVLDDWITDYHARSGFQDIELLDRGGAKLSDWAYDAAVQISRQRNKDVKLPAIKTLVEELNEARAE